MYVRQKKDLGRTLALCLLAFLAAVSLLSGISPQTSASGGIGMVQVVNVGAGSTSTISASWNTATTAGNHLVAVMTHNNTRNISSVPSGWVLRDSMTGTYSNAGWSVFEISNAASRSGAETFTYALAGDLSLTLYEISGLDPTYPVGNLEKHTGASGTVPSMSLNTNTNDGLVIAVVGMASNGLAPGNIATSGWTSIGSTRSTHGYTRARSFSSPVSMQLGNTTTNAWRGAMFSYTAPTPPPVWSVNDSLYRKKITVDHTKVAENVTDFPVYLDLSLLGSNFFSHTDPGGADIRFTTADGVTEVPFEIVNIDTGTNSGEAYFKAPSLSSTTDTDFYIYYGGWYSSGYSPTDTYGRNNVWTNNFDGVWHLQEASGTLVDSTGAIDASTVTGTTYGSAGKMGKSLSILNAGGITIPSYTATAQSTIQAWIKPVEWVTYDMFYALSNNTYFAFRENGTTRHGWTDGANAAVYDAWNGFGNATLGNWDLYSVVHSASGSNLEINGYRGNTLIDNTSSTAGYTPLPIQAIGHRGGSLQMNGDIDEIRISGTSRTAGWISTDYANQSAPNTFYAIGAEEVPQSGGLGVDIVDDNGLSVTNPSLAMSPVSTAFGCVTSTGTFGTSSQKIRIQNDSTSPAWSVAIAATDGSTALWSSGGALYDFNDPTGSPAGCSPGTDNDTYAGQLSINPGLGTIAPEVGCTATGLSSGATAYFDEGVTDAITLVSASSTADTNCYWDITGIGIEQQIPSEQPAGNYSLNLTLTVVAN